MNANLINVRRSSKVVSSVFFLQARPHRDVILGNRPRSILPSQVYAVPPRRSAQVVGV